MIARTEQFFKEKLHQSPYYKDHPADLAYRIQHTYRVANIGRQIALKEGFNVQAMVIGCLLHDVSYCEPMEKESDWLNHGRRAAAISRPFLQQQGLNENVINDICYGIAIHVDDEADFKGEKTPFAITIGDADNLDRFDVYRIYENLQNMAFNKLSLDDQFQKVESSIAKLQSYYETPLATKTGTALWQERIAFQLDFFKKLQLQLKSSTQII